ncbi:MAG: ABC transporter ATP-binding protein [Deltaproteobacteria bacterium]|nr:ABC transporter ATP-binding protein [Deltaproteobacteria bacterium]MBM4323314.1 ABC transporter ATP-binding protein [Deltaproteobacteria bacterium]
MFSIQTTNLTKAFGSITAVNGLNLEVKTGEIFGLVGPDASGKTTTLRMLSGILRPDKGEAKVAGCDIRKEAERLKEKVGYLPQRFGLYGDLSVLENIHFYADLYQVPKRERKDRVKRLLQFANLEPFGQRKAQDLSGGMKQKLGLICALIHTPEILFLDEPTTGVDPLSRRDFWVILYDLLKEGVTILFSTSYMDEAERCNHIGLIHQGELLIADSPSAVKMRIGGTVLELRLEDHQKGMRVLDRIKAFRSLVLSGDKIHILVDQPEEGERMIRDVLKTEGMGILDLNRVRPSLEDAFVSMVKEKGRSSMQS